MRRELWFKLHVKQQSRSYNGRGEAAGETGRAFGRAEPPVDSQAALPELPGTTLKGPVSALGSGRACGSAGCRPLVATSTRPNYLIARPARFLPSHFRSSLR